MFWLRKKCSSVFSVMSHDNSVKWRALNWTADIWFLVKALGVFSWPLCPHLLQGPPSLISSRYPRALFPRGKCSWDVQLITLLSLVQRLRMDGALPLFPRCTFMVWFLRREYSFTSFDFFVVIHMVVDWCGRLRYVMEYSTRKELCKPRR
jgi:hypothetical protein